MTLADEYVYKKKTQAGSAPVTAENSHRRGISSSYHREDPLTGRRQVLSHGPRDSGVPDPLP